MTKERLEALRAKLNDPEYINKACSELGTRFTNVWGESGYEKPNTALKRVHICGKTNKRTQKTSLLEMEAIRERNKNILHDYFDCKMSYQQLSVKYKIDIQLIRATIYYWRKKNGRT